MIRSCEKFFPEVIQFMKVAEVGAMNERQLLDEMRVCY
jgi:hypothetical protein